MTRMALPGGLELPSVVERRGLELQVESTVDLRLSIWDTPDNRLARNGVTLSYVDGEWLLRLPDGEQRAPGVGHRVPAELRSLVTGWVRTARLRAVHSERVRRTSYRLADADGVTTAQLTEEEVSTATGPPATAAGSGAVPATSAPAAPATAVVTAESATAEADAATPDAGTPGAAAAGAVPPTDGATAAEQGAPDHPADGPFEPDAPAAGEAPASRIVTLNAGPADSARLERLLFDAGARPAPQEAGRWQLAALWRPARPSYGDLPARRPLSPASASAVVMAHVFATQAEKLIRLDLPVRRGGEDAVHQMRVTCRRLRAALRTYRPLLAEDRARAMSAELAWLAGSLGAARDLEVLRARIADIAEVDPHHPVNPLALTRIDELLLAREQASHSSAARVMGSRRYTTLLEQVVAAGRSPGVSAAAAAPARAGVLPLVAATWLDFAKRARKLGPARRDPMWHRVRILGKRARYACESAEPVFGPPARRLAARLTAVQDILGEHQDAVTTADTLLELAHENPEDTELVLACGRLVERERAAGQAARAAFHAAWSTVDSPKYTRWLRG